MTAPEDPRAAATGSAWWARLTPYCLGALAALSVFETDLAGAPLVITGTALLAFAERLRPPSTLTRLGGFALIAVATPLVALYLPIVVPELFWKLGFRQAVAAVTLCFLLCFASLIGHGVEPYGWAVAPLAVGYVLSLVAAAWISQIMTISKDREVALANLERSREELAAVSRKAGETAERSRVAQKVHDGVTQRLVLLRMLLEAEQKRSDSARITLAHEQALAALEESRSLLASSQERAHHQSAHEMRAAIESTVASVREGGEFTVELCIDDDPRLGDLPALQQSVLLHLLREALNNTAQHARAQAVQVRLSGQEDGVGVAVEDDGVGLETTSEPEPGRGFGLPGLRAYVGKAGGELSVENRPDGGTRVHAVFPYAHPRQPVRELDDSDAGRAAVSSLHTRSDR